MALTFSGGIYVNNKFDTDLSQIKEIDPSKKYRLPIDPAHTITANVGNRVLLGEKIADSNSEKLASVYSPVSGVVIEAHGKYVEIENDGLFERSPEIIPFGVKSGKGVSDITVDDLILVLKDSGIYDSSINPVPAWEIFRRATENGKLRRVVVNCMDKDPLVFSARLLAVENTAQLVGGLKIILSALKIRNGMFALSEDSTEIASALKKEISGDVISIRTFSSKYPQAAEQMLVYSITGRELPVGGKGVDVGTLVLDAQAVVAIYNAFASGEPSIYKTVTVSGDALKYPAVFKVAIGTPIIDLIVQCKIVDASCATRVLLGNSLCPTAIDDLDMPVDITTDSVLVMTVPEISQKRRIFVKSTSCNRCGKCAEVCPVRLDPSKFALLAEKGKGGSCKKYGLDYCILCGACEFECPCGVPLMKYIRESLENKEPSENIAAENGGEASDE